MAQSSNSGFESSAIKVLTRAVSLDQASKFPEALLYYQEGIQLLMDVLPECSEEKRLKLRKRITEYMDRAEEVKIQVDKEKESGKYHEVLQIEENDIGYDYEKLFKRFLGANVKGVVIEDPYIISNHQIYNFLRFSELLVKYCPNLKVLSLTTSSGSKHKEIEEQQNKKLAKISDSLKLHNVNLKINYCEDLHDREIRFSNGWIIKIGRGLDIYKPPYDNFSIGFCDLSLRACHKTTVNIFHRKHTTEI